MANYQIAFNNTTKVVTIQAKGDLLPAGSNKIGEFVHADVEPAIADLEFDVNHVFFQHVRDALYHVNASTGLAVPGTLQFPNNITDMAGITVVQDTTYVVLTGIAITPGGTSTITVAAPTVQLGITKTPSGASNGNVTWVSSVTRVANGSTVITATSQDGGFTATKNITVTA